jgi:hypothetical protein
MEGALGPMAQGILDSVWIGLGKGVAALKRARDRLQVQSAPDPLTGEVRQSAMQLLLTGFLSNLIVILRIGQWIVGSFFVFVWALFLAFVVMLIGHFTG